MTDGGRLDVVVLAGGTGRRLGGASKPEVVARGARLLDHVLNGVARVRDQLPPGRIAVVAPPSVAVPAGVLRTLEDPPLGGPVAGIAAGLARLAQAATATRGPIARAGRTTDALAGDPAPLTAVIPCDAPDSWRALPALLETLGRCEAADGACATDGEHIQFLLGVYRTAALAAAVAPQGVALRDVAVRRALRTLNLAHV
ncbi:MAG: NTP transferase domain-containing protein, partial [Actinomycetaceae bacterium]|nr:NTP transferase domain-containing protein [Actinomycetaceae bacterium]